MNFEKQVVDSHFHLYGWYNHGDHAFWECAEDYMSGLNLRAININALPSVERDVSNNIIAALFKLRHPDVYAHGGLIYDTYPVSTGMTPGMEPEQQYQELMDIGFDGIKMLETKPTEAKVIGRPVDDMLFDGMFAAAERDGTHMVWHVGDPAPFWNPELAPQSCIEAGWFYGDGTFPTLEEIYGQVFHVLDQHPNLNVTFAHFFFMSEERERLAQVFQKYPNVNVDLTPGSEMYGSFGADYEGYRAFFARYADRIEFGTDCSDEGITVNNLTHAGIVYRFVTTDEDFDVWDYRFKGLNLEEEVQDKILSRNFLRRVGLQPKPINVGALKAYAAKYRRLVMDKQVLAKIDAELKKYE